MTASLLEQLADLPKAEVDALIRAMAPGAAAAFEYHWRYRARPEQLPPGGSWRVWLQDLGFDLANTVYALDSTTIDLCLAVFPWAHFRTTKACSWRKQGAAVKMHTLLDLRGNIPSFIHVSDGKLHDVHALDPRFREGRLCCSRRRAQSTSWIGALSISRPPPCVASRRSLLRHPRQIEHGCPSGLFGPDRPYRRYRLRSDHPGWSLHQPALPRTPAAHPLEGHRNEENTGVPDQPVRVAGATICALYKSRWQVELFFKWIKQHLRIKRFFGTPKMP